MWDQLGSCPWQRITSCQHGAPSFIISLTSSPLCSVPHCPTCRPFSLLQLVPLHTQRAWSCLLPCQLWHKVSWFHVDQTYSWSRISNLGTWILLDLCAECFSSRHKPCSVSFQLHLCTSRNCLYICAIQLYAFCCWTFGPISYFQMISLCLTRILFWRWTYYTLQSDTE